MVRDAFLAPCPHAGSDVVRDAFLAPCPHAGGLFFRALVMRAHETPSSNSKYETLKALELCLTPHLWPVQAAAGALPIPDVPEHERRGCGGWDCISCMPVLPIHVSASWHVPAVPRTYFAAQHNRSGWCRPQHVRVVESVARMHETACTLDDFAPVHVPRPCWTLLRGAHLRRRQFGLQKFFRKYP